MTSLCRPETAASPPGESEVYVVHGIPITFITNSSALRKGLSAFLGYFRSGCPGDLLSPSPWRFYLWEEDSRTFPHELWMRTAGIEPVAGWFRLSSPPLGKEVFQCYRTGRWLMLRRGWEKPVLFSCFDSDERRVAIWFFQPVSPYSQDFRQVYLINLYEIMKCHGLFPVHAAAVVRQGDGVLLLGAQGAGKTTLSLTLVKHGWGWLADDTPLARYNGKSVEILTFPEEVKVTRNTIARFPNLAPLLTSPPKYFHGKWSFAPDHYFPDSLTHRAEPTVLVFLKRQHGLRKAFLEPVHPQRTFLNLLEQTIVLNTSRERGREYLGLLNRLAKQARAYSCYYGSDLDQAAERLRDLLP